MKRIISNQYMFAIVTKVVIVILGILTSVIINRFLGPSLKGQYSYTLNIVNMSVLVLNLGIYQSYPYFKRQIKNEVKNKFFSVFVVQFITYEIFAIMVAILLHDLIYILAVLLIPLMIFAKQLNFMALVENINDRNKMNVANQIVYVAILAMVYFFLPQNLVYIFVVLLIKESLIIIRVIRKFELMKPLHKLDWKLTKESIKYGFLPMLTVLLLTMNYSIDTIILKRFVNYDQIGLYSVGVTLANQVWLIPDAFKDVLFSKTARSDSIEDLLISIKLNLYFGVISVIGIITLGKPLINILYGSDFISSYFVTIVLVAGLIPMIVFKFLNTLFVAKGKQKLSFLILLVSVIMNVILNFILIPSQGIVGAAVASVFSYTICGIAYLLFFSKEYDLGFNDVIIINRAEYHRIKKLFKR